MKKKLFIRGSEIADMIGVSRYTAYQMVKKMNAELDAMGFITIAGRIPTQYFEEKFYGVNQIVEMPTEERADWFHA